MSLEGPWVRLGLAGCALGLLAAPGATQDVVALRDGTQRTGALQSCIGDRCQMSGTSIPLADISWMSFRQEPGFTPAIRVGRDDVAILRDGGEHRGRLLGISLGTVSFEGSDLDRETVASIHLADTTAGADPQIPDGKIDALAMRDGSTRIGELVACAGGSCYLEGQGVIARDDVAAIAFGGAGDDGSSTLTAEAEDQLILRQGTVRKGAVYGISPEDVVAASGTHDRDAVAAIVFASRAAAGTGGVATEIPGPGAPMPPGPSARADSDPGRPPASGLPSGQGNGTLGAYWSGTIEGTYTVEDTWTIDSWTYGVRLRLREIVRPGAVVNGQTLFQNIELRSEEAHFSQVFSTSETSGPRRCSGPGQALGTAFGHLVVKTRDVDLSAYLGIDLPLNGGYYSIGTQRPADDYTVSCERPDDWNSASYIGSSLLVGRNPRIPWVETHLSDPEVRYLTGGRMEGRYETAIQGHRTTVSWSLCRQGADCPAPGNLPEETPLPFDPCGRSGQQAALSETCQAQLASLVTAIAPALAEYNLRTAAAEDNRDAFQESQTYCALHDAFTTVLEAILTGGAGRSAEAARALLYLRDVVEKAQDGDLASMLYPDKVKAFLGYYNQAKAIWFELTADKLSRMQRDHDACAGKVPAQTYLAAKKFLADLAAAKQVWDSKVAPGLNDLRTKGLECAAKRHEAWRACIADAACRGLTPDCGPAPSL